MSQAERFLKACRREPTDCTPIWLINQYGRYLPEYREIRRKHSFMDMLKTPELAAQLTVLPVDKFGVDAAILFSDILPFLESIGFQLDLSGNGPSISNPIGIYRQCHRYCRRRTAGTRSHNRLCRCPVYPGLLRGRRWQCHVFLSC